MRLVLAVNEIVGIFMDELCSYTERYVCSDENADEGEPTRKSR